jgi:hypothetical protein
MVAEATPKETGTDRIVATRDDVGHGCARKQHPSRIDPAKNGKVEPIRSN